MDGQTYESAQQRLQWFEERDRARHIGESGRTLVFDHGRRTRKATLLFHGLSATPRQFIAIAQALHGRGHNVFVPRLPQHGHSNRLSEALATMSADQLAACASDALALARGLGEEVTVAGFSIGGLLAAYVGQFEDVRRIVAISPFLGVAFIPDILRVPMARWFLRRPNRFYWWDPILRERQHPEHGYPRFATHAIAHGLTLAHDVVEASASAAPLADDLVIVFNPSDSTVNKRAILKLARQWRARKPQSVRLHRLSNLPPFVHDIIEPNRYPGVSERIRPAIVDLIDGESP